MTDIIKGIVNRISVYGLINHLIPGAIYVVLVNNFTVFKIPTDNELEMILICYFVGVTISRIGSLANQCIFSKLKKKGRLVVPHLPYVDFCAAEKNDKDMRLRFLSDVNDMYRTFFALSFVLLIMVLANIIWPYIRGYSWTRNTAAIVVTIGMMLLYAFSYSRQSTYVVEKIKFLNEKHDEAG